MLDVPSQRWRHGQHSWRHRHEGGFNPDRYRVVSLAETEARTFVQTHHYSRSWPSARFRYGLIDQWIPNGRLVGVAVLGVPVQSSVLTRPFPTLVPYRESLELSRLVLLDEVPANAESWFCARVFANAATEHGLRGVVAFSDPLARRIGDRIVSPGHVGCVYQALGATYTGRGTARTLTVLPDGTVLNDRARAKVTAGDQGAMGVIARLVALGATVPGEAAPGSAWLATALSQVNATRLPHPGNHRYVFRVGRTSRERSRVHVGLPACGYPKQTAKEDCHV